jgi:hypothetical protein
MIVQRTCYINPVEPEYLGFRISQDVDTRVDFTFLDQNGTPHNEDMVVQMQLTGRSTNMTEFYSVPTIDVANGRARARIPADIRYDPNGWRLRLTGTLAQEPRVLAYGVVTALEGEGPQIQPQDVIDTVDLAFNRDEEANLNVTVWADASKSAAYDLTARGTTINAYVLTADNGSVLVQFTATVISANQVNLYLTADQVNALPDACWWSLIATTAAGFTTLCQGTVRVSGAVKPPFADFMAPWMYVKQDNLTTPAAGQIIHSNYALDTLRIHRFDEGGADRGPVLDEIVAGDQLGVTGLTWGITAISKPTADWYQVSVSPAAQASVSGLQFFTFHRP